MELIQLHHNVSLFLTFRDLVRQLKHFSLYSLTICIFHYIFLECFRQNSFEQICINFINEKFRQFSTNRLIKEEIEWHKIEDLELPEIDFLDNQNVIGTGNSKITTFMIYE